MDTKKIKEKHRSFIRVFIKIRWNKTIPKARDYFKECGLSKQEFDEYRMQLNKL